MRTTAGSWLPKEVCEVYETMAFEFAFWFQWRGGDYMNSASACNCKQADRHF